MATLNDADITFDQEFFPQEDPAVTAKRAAEEEKRRKKEEAALKKRKAPPSAAQLKAVKELADETKEQRTAREKVVLLRQIDRYMERFPERLSSIKLPRGWPGKAKYEQVVEIHQRIELQLHSGGNGEMLFTGLGMLVGFAQSFADSRGYTKLSGPNADLRGTFQHQHDNLIDTLDELAIKYESWLATGPEKRLAMSLFMMTFMVIRANNASDVAEEEQSEPMPDDLKGDFISAMRAAAPDVE